MISDCLLTIIRCPLDGQRLELADATTLARLQADFAAETLRDQNDGRVDEPFDQALVTEDHRRAYLVRQGIPTLIPSEAIPLSPAS